MSFVEAQLVHAAIATTVVADKHARAKALFTWAPMDHSAACVTASMLWPSGSMTKQP